MVADVAVPSALGHILKDTSLVGVKVVVGLCMLAVAAGREAFGRSRGHGLFLSSFVRGVDDALEVVIGVVIAVMGWILFVLAVVVVMMELVMSRRIAVVVVVVVVVVRRMRIGMVMGSVRENHWAQLR